MSGDARDLSGMDVPVELLGDTELSDSDLTDQLGDLGWLYTAAPEYIAQKAALTKAFLFLEFTGTIRLSVEQRESLVNQISCEGDAKTIAGNAMTALDKRSFHPRHAQLIRDLIEKSLKDLEENVSYSEATFPNSLGNAIKIALKQYVDLNRNGISAPRTENLRVLDEIASSDLSDKNLTAAIQHYLHSDSFDPGVLGGSRLQSLIQDAMVKHQRSRANRTLQVKTWESSQDKGNSGHVVLAIPGLQDSVDTFNLLAPLYVERGIKVISYDQAGQGYDKLRGKRNHSLDLSQMQFDFYNMLSKLQNDPEVERITLVGHSLGGAMLAHSLPSLSQFNKVQHIEFLAPATMKNPILQLLGNLWTLMSNASDMTRTVREQRLGDDTVRRIGGTGVSIGVFLRFRAFVENAFYNLRHAFTHNDPYPFSMAVHYDRDDGLVSRRNFEAISAAPSNNVHEKAVYRYAGGRHHFHYHNPDSIQKNLTVPAVQDNLPLDEDTDTQLNS